MTTNINYFSKFGIHGGLFFDDLATFTYNKLINFIRQKRLNDNYIEIKTPTLVSKKIWEKTGHEKFFGQNMYNFDHFSFKPMSCPGATLFVKNYLKFAKADVIKIFELGTVFRKEKSGTLSPLKRMLTFSQDDIHIFHFDGSKLLDTCISILSEWKYLYEDILNTKYEIILSTMPENSLAEFENGETILKKALDKLNIPIKIESGEGAFYGPKLDLMAFLPDNSRIQLSTLQIDCYLAKNLNLEKNKLYPIVVHSALFGSIERFMYFLLEINNNIFPFWCHKTPFLFINLLGFKNDNIKQYLAFLNSIQKTIYTENKPGNALKENKKINFTFFYGNEEIITNSLKMRDNLGKNTIILPSFLRSLVEKYTRIQNYFGFFDKIIDIIDY
jgi:threonyl-tRNA synthetase